VRAETCRSLILVINCFLLGVIFRANIDCSTVIRRIRR